jgi:hypothetical protein
MRNMQSDRCPRRANGIDDMTTRVSEIPELDEKHKKNSDKADTQGASI